MEITTIAGVSGELGFRDGELSKSLFCYPRGICLDGEGNLLVADTWNHCIRKVDFGRKITSTIAGRGDIGIDDGDALTESKFRYPCYLAVRGDVIYVSDTYNDSIRGIRNGKVFTLVTGLNRPTQITIDRDGGILIVDKNEVKRIDTNDASISVSIPSPPLLRGVPLLSGIAASTDGIIYTSNCDGRIARWDGERWKILKGRGGGNVYTLKLDSYGNVLFTQNGCIKRMSWSDGRVSWFAGSEVRRGNRDGPLSDATFGYPFDVAMNDSFMYVSDRENHTIRRISLLGIWNKGKGFKLLSSLFRESLPVPSPHKKGDTNPDDLTGRKEEREEFGSWCTEGYHVSHFSIPREGCNLRNVSS